MIESTIYIILYVLKFIIPTITILLGFIYIDSKSQQLGKKKKSQENPEVTLIQNISDGIQASQEYICKAVPHDKNSIVTRHQLSTCHELYEYEMRVPLNKKRIILPKGQWFNCYGCNTKVDTLHPVYVFSCIKCGLQFQKFRHFTRDLSDRVALVTGARTKLGHQILLKLLRAGAIVVGTTRYPLEAMQLFERYSDFELWKKRINFYPNSMDLDKLDLIKDIKELENWLRTHFGRLDILVNCAAQTIRVREKNKQIAVQKNRYGDAKFVTSDLSNSWQLKIHDLEQKEIEEVLRVNAVAPTILIQQLIPLLQLSEISSGPYIINVHAKEGLFSTNKSGNHIHTNMAKAGLAMLTKCLLSSNLKTLKGKPFSIHGCDPGWFSIDEYYEDKRPWIIPPLDEIDGAARILYPVFKNISSCGSTRRHFFKLCI